MININFHSINKKPTKPPKKIKKTLLFLITVFQQWHSNLCEKLKKRW